MLPSFHRLNIHGNDIGKRVFTLASSTPFIQLKYHVAMSNYIYGGESDPCVSNNGSEGGGESGGGGAGEGGGGGGGEGGGGQMDVADGLQKVKLPDRGEGDTSLSSLLSSWFVGEGSQYMGRKSILKQTTYAHVPTVFSIYVFVIHMTTNVGTILTPLMLFKNPGGRYQQWDANDIFNQLYAGSYEWFVDMSTEPVTHESVVSTKKRPLPATGLIPNTVTKQKVATRLLVGAPGLDVSAPPTHITKLSLWQEYETHCLWLRMLQVPCKASIEAIQSITDKTDLTSHITHLSKKEWKPIQAVLNDRQFKADKSFNENYDTPKEEYVTSQVLWWDKIPNCKLNHRQFPHLGTGHYGRGAGTVSGTQTYVSWLRHYMVTKTGPVYGGGRLEEAERGTLDTNHDNYQVEHITPQSWTPLVTLISMFRYVVSDPTMIFMAWGKTNQSRSNKPILFGTNSDEDDLYIAWPHIDGWMAAVVARAVIHATMTYPLLTSNDNVLNSDGTTSTRAYLDQIDTIVDLAASEPRHWEIMITMQCYARFGCLNPLVVSSDTRAQIRNPGSPFYKLLRARWSGKDLTSSALLRTVRDLVDPH